MGTYEDGLGTQILETRNSAYRGQSLQICQLSEGRRGRASIKQRQT